MKRFAPIILICFAISHPSTAVAATTSTATTHPSADAVIDYLNQTIDWYRRVASLEESSRDAQQTLVRTTLLQNARQVVQLTFKFARAEAAIMEFAAKESPGTSRKRSVVAAAKAAKDRADDVRNQIDQLDQQFKSAPTDSLRLLYAKRYELVARMNLANTQRDILEEYATFMVSAESGEGATLSQKIEELARSVPEALSNTKASATTAPSGADSFHAESAGIFGLLGRMLSLSSRMSEMNRLEEAAMDLRQTSDRLRDPMRQAAIETMRDSEVIGSATQPAQRDPAEIEAHGMQIDTLTDRFKQLTSGAIPLAEQSVVLDVSRDALIDWHSAITRQYDEAFHALLLRLGTMLAIILVIVVISELWKRATFRYVRDQRRQRQIVFIRRIVIGLVVLIIVIASVVTEFGSLATFAGLITAGVAVALQTVILSGVAYFFFIGRFGVRVGDRVTISGITGDVIEIGLFRIYLMELGGNKADLHPTGRVVVYSNSVLFQPTAFYKQLPGSDYIWHEVALTLTPESDPRLAEQRLLNAVNSVYGEYREAVEAQHAQISRSLHVEMGAPRPEGRLRFVESGLEFIVRYPVELHRAAEIDERITRELLKVINEEPNLKVITAGTPSIRPA